jgi:RyR domain/ATPase family associated with various cellular activities (AAA)
METKQLKAVVAGDVTVDWFEWPVAAKSEVTGSAAGAGASCSGNWQLHDGIRLSAKPGGAVLLAGLLQAAGVTTLAAPEIFAPESVPATEVLHSHVRLARFPLSVDGGGKDQVWRIKDNCGYTGPDSGRVQPLAVAPDVRAADLVILDDAGNGFRDEPSVWPQALAAAGRPLVLLKMSRPLATGSLFQELCRSHGDRLVVVVDGDDLRCEGANISRRLSWERTAKDFVWQMANNRKLAPLAGCRNLVVRFGLDGAIHRVVAGDRISAVIYYDPARIEGEYDEQHPGEMMGLGAAFLAALASQVAQGGLEHVGEGARDGVAASRRLLDRGFGRASLGPDWILDDLFEASPNDAVIADVVVPVKSSLTSADPDFWTILQESTHEGLEAVALNYVEKGTDPVLDRVPVGHFGKLKTIDRTEIEGYRSIKNLISEYLAAGYVKRPLCIGVFGPPGAGKTFSVTQIARSVGEGVVQSLGFNVAQWESPRDLAGAFHRVRDVALEGKVPLVFFDEFDASFEGSPLGWLKFFLDPMQDGRFKDGESSHPVGKAIFVFAGATSSSLAEFTREGGDGQTIERFRMVKGPDFVSRLRGYVDILGINQRSDQDQLYVIRRAMALRAFLEAGVRQLMDPTGRIRIDAGVLRALIKIPEYRHGMRSLESILDMSMLSGREIFEQSALPPAPQLDLHVDAETFMRLVARDALVGAARERIAQAIHEAFVHENVAGRTEGDLGMSSWDDLTEENRESNREQADWYPTYLDAVGCSFLAAKDESPRQVEFTAAEIEKLAKMEHERWWAQKRAAGYVFASVRDDTEKTHPCMVPWDQLSEAERDKDREQVRKIPERMAAAGFETYRLGS